MLVKCYISWVTAEVIIVRLDSTLFQEHWGVARGGTFRFVISMLFIFSRFFILIDSIIPYPSLKLFPGNAIASKTGILPGTRPIHSITLIHKWQFRQLPNLLTSIVVHSGYEWLTSLYSLLIPLRLHVIMSLNQMCRLLCLQLSEKQRDFFFIYFKKDMEAMETTLFLLLLS